MCFLCIKSSHIKCPGGNNVKTPPHALHKQNLHVKRINVWNLINEMSKKKTWMLELACHVVQFPLFVFKW